MKNERDRKEREKRKQQNKDRQPRTSEHELEMKPRAWSAARKVFRKN